MNATKWKKVLETEVAQRIADAGSAAVTKLGVLAGMYDREPDTMPLGKLCAYEELAEQYAAQN